MLGKLIKNDFKASAHTLAPLYLIALAVGIATAISYAFEDLLTIQAIGTLALLLLSFAVLIIPVFLVLSYFNKSLYSNQGYLTYTLPAKSRDILFSKAVVCFSWIIAGYLMFIGIYFFVYRFFMSKISEEAKMMINELYDMFEALPDKSVLVKALVALLAIFFFEILVLVAQIFFSMTLSNIKPFNQFGNFGGFVLFAIIFCVMFYLTMQLTQNAPPVIVFVDGGAKLKPYVMDEVAGFTVGIAGIIFQFICSVAMFIGTNYLMKKKINIR